MIRKTNIFDLLTVMFLFLVLSGNQKVGWAFIFIPYLAEGSIYLLAMIDRHFDPFHRIKAWIVYWQGKMQLKLDTARNLRYLKDRTRQAQRNRAKAVSANDPITYKKN